LRIASLHGNHKLAELAGEVVRTRQLLLPPRLP